MDSSINDCKSYLDALARTLAAVPSDVVDQIAGELLRAYWNDQNIFVFGNGGSAATASHFACDLGKGTTKWLRVEDRRFRVIALTDNVPLITAWANDCDYDGVFAEQLRNLVRPGDVVLAVSGSGNSRNILKALQVAAKNGAITVGLTGFHGGQMLALCHHCLVVPSDNMELIEDLHLSVCHSLSTVLRAAISNIAASDRELQPTPYYTVTPVLCSDSGTTSTSRLQLPKTRVKLDSVGLTSNVQTLSRDHVDAD